ncbi:protein Exd1 homolog [Drosophila biarmipes]|uniref:protein Exd1 homolog n=1 Tax=Drosophila biarmipes TaxID=125945 RepID=UPI001CDAA540|nr:protein Exd1 homolog [Drosophila biarmipes]
MKIVRSRTPRWRHCEIQQSDLHPATYVDDGIVIVNDGPALRFPKAQGTTHETYFFDIKALGSIFPELARILEVEHPRKVVHYSHRIADHMHHKHRLTLGGICDTFMALPEAISLVFSLPMEDLLCEEVIGASESRRNFTARLLSRSQMRYIARMVQLQHLMHDRLIYGSICEEVQRMPLAFRHNYSGFRSCDVAINMGPSSRFGFHLIDPANRRITLPTPDEIDRQELEHKKSRN